MHGRDESEEKLEEKLEENVFPISLELLAMIFVWLGDGNVRVKPRFGSSNREQRAWNCTCKFFRAAALTVTIPELAVRYYWALAPAVQTLFRHENVEVSFYFLNSQLNRVSSYINHDIDIHDLYCLTGQTELVAKTIARKKALMGKSNKKPGFLDQRNLVFIALSENAAALKYYVNELALTPEDIAPLDKIASVEKFLFCLCLMGTKAAWRATEAIVTVERIKEFISKCKVLECIQEDMLRHVFTPESMDCMLDYCDPVKDKSQLDKLCVRLSDLKKFDLLRCFNRYAEKNITYPLPTHAYRFPEDIERILRPDFNYNDTNITFLVSSTDEALRLELLLKIFEAIKQTKVLLQAGKDILLKLIITGKLALFKTLMQDEFFLSLVYENEHEFGHLLLKNVLSCAPFNNEVNVETLSYLLDDLKINSQSKHNAGNQLIFAAAASTTKFLKEFMKLKPELNVLNGRGKTLMEHIITQHFKNYGNNISAEYLVLNMILLIQSGLNAKQLFSGAESAGHCDMVRRQMVHIPKSRHFGKLIKAIIAAGGDIYRKEVFDYSWLSFTLQFMNIVVMFDEETLRSILEGYVDESSHKYKECIDVIFLNLCVQGTSSLLALIIKRGANLRNQARLKADVFRLSISNPIHLARFDAYIAAHNEWAEGFSGLDFAIAGGHTEAVRVLLDHADPAHIHELCALPHLFHTDTTYDLAVAMGNQEILQLLEPFRLVFGARNGI